MQQRSFYKSAKLYWLILGTWIPLAILLWVSLYPLIREAFARPAIGILVFASVVFITYFWLNGQKDVIYTLFYHIYLKKRIRLPYAIYHDGKLPIMRPAIPLNMPTYPSYPLVLMLYCTYNDFNPENLFKCLKQDYQNTRFIILDDSTKDHCKARINEFAASHNILVVRRPNNIGFKAGNINHFLKTYLSNSSNPLAEELSHYRYFVLLDSDEVVPENFVSRMLDYFVTYPEAGIVQASHRASGNVNNFMSLFARGVDSHWPTYQVVKATYGFMSLLGHGAMISRECYEIAGGFPHVVAEDICFALEARWKGYYTLFAIDVVCEEEYPVDYLFPG